MLSMCIHSSCWSSLMKRLHFIKTHHPLNEYSAPNVPFTHLKRAQFHRCIRKRYCTAVIATAIWSSGASRTTFQQLATDVVSSNRQQPARFIGSGGWTDAEVLSLAGIESMLLEPIGGGAHAVEEWVDLKSVIMSVFSVCSPHIFWSSVPLRKNSQFDPEPWWSEDTTLGC